MSWLGVARHRMIILMTGMSCWWHHDNRNSSNLMRMMMRMMGDWMMRSWMRMMGGRVMRSWVMINHVMMLNHWGNVVTMTMHLMMLLVNSMMGAMISHTMTHMMGGGRDCHMMATAWHRCWASMGWGCAERGEQGESSMRRDIMGRREHMSRAES